ncbi:hypothetical protein Q8A67_021615 [Cirrhinus molitorella]|uniref:Secreted protein n=1 Tax=Cirrhinus molitorella TaxID=172907 RepID=A0AA88PBV1_9TELE|nr:hypothetical protein Q8A67_021615 [Cirrhinus molitorella]
MSYPDFVCEAPLSVFVCLCVRVMCAQGQYEVERKGFIGGGRSSSKGWVESTKHLRGNAEVQLFFREQGRTSEVSSWLKSSETSPALSVHRCVVRGRDLQEPEAFCRSPDST